MGVKKIIVVLVGVVVVVVVVVVAVVGVAVIIIIMFMSVDEYRFIYWRCMVAKILLSPARK